jgi:hypothetical protein
MSTTVPSKPVDLVKFLFLADIDINQAEYILDNYPNFTMPTYEAFFDFFKSNGIKLERYRQTTQDERLTLIEKFQSFKQSYEYEIIKKYIQEERELQKLQTATDPRLIQDALSGIEKYKLDAFDYYIVRKVITGDEFGVLPSESLKDTLDALINTVDIYPKDGTLTRDDLNRVVSYENIFRNEGRLVIPAIDDRFKRERFNYVLNKSFQNLSDAVLSERNVEKKIQDILSNVTTAPEELQEFLSELSNLKRADENTIPGLQIKIDRLEEIIQAKQELIDSMVDAEIEHEGYIDSIALDNIKKDVDLVGKDETITNLQSTIDVTLAEISGSVTSQLNAMTNAIDALAGQVVSQTNAANSTQDQQLVALQEQLGRLTNDLTALTNQLKGKQII